MRRTLPLVITALFGALYLTFDGVSTLSSYRQILDQWNQVSNGFAVALTCTSLTMVHARYMRRGDRAFYSGTFLVALYGMITLGIVKGRTFPLYQQIFSNTAGVLEGVVLSAVAFYIVSSAYRAFRLRSLEAGVMMFAAIFVMLANVSLGELIHPELPRFGRWLLDTWNVAGMRAITIGATLGGAATAIRVLVGIERTHLGGGD